VKNETRNEEGEGTASEFDDQNEEIFLGSCSYTELIMKRTE